MQSRIEWLEAELRDRSEAEVAWTTERSLLRAMIDQVPHRLFVKDREDRFMAVNETMVRRQDRLPGFYR